MKKYAVLVGVEAFEPGSGISRLNYACRDVHALGQVLRAECGFDAVRVLATATPAAAFTATSSATHTATLTAARCLGQLQFREFHLIKPGKLFFVKDSPDIGHMYLYC